MVATFSRVKLVTHLHYQTNSPQRNKSKKKKKIEKLRYEKKIHRYIVHAKKLDIANINKDL